MAWREPLSVCNTMVLLALVIIIFSPIGQSSGKERDVEDVRDVGDAGDARDNVTMDMLVEAWALQYVRSDYVHVGIILAGIKGLSPTKRPIIAKLEELLQSLLRHSKGTRAHFIFFTDPESWPHISEVFRNEIGRFLSESVLFDRPMVAFPRLRVEYVNLDSMVSRHRQDIEDMKKLFGYHYPEGTVFPSEDGGPALVPTRKYLKDLFYIVPLLHRELPAAIEKLVMLDIDLEFRIDLLELYKMFDDFSETELIGLGLELSPHYYIQALVFIKANPGTGVASPGPQQGFNTGVALYHIGRMRASLQYRTEVEVARMKKLTHDKYRMAGTVGDQDWLTVLGWEVPSLFHLLPCQYNMQTHQGYNTAKWAAVWGQYRNCTGKPKIIHKNGSGLDLDLVSETMSNSSYKIN